MKSNENKSLSQSNVIQSHSQSTTIDQSTDYISILDEDNSIYFSGDSSNNSNKLPQLSKCMKTTQNTNEENLKTSQNFYFKINSKSYFSELLPEDDRIINLKFKNINNKYSTKKYTSLNSILKTFIEKITSSSDTGQFSISLEISKYFYSSKKFKNSLEFYVNYFYEVRREIAYSNTFILKSKAMRNLGYILCYAYSQMHYYKIKDLVTLFSCIKDSKEDILNVLTNFYNYCNEVGKDPNLTQKTQYWDKFYKRFRIPGVLLFIINIFSPIKTLDIDINFQDEIFNEDDIKLFFITMINLNIFISKLNYMKVNFMHKNTQNDIYNNYYYFVLNKKLAKISQSIKTNSFSHKDEIYKKKWNFKNNFILEEKRNAKSKIEKEKKKEEMIFNDFTVIEDERAKIFNSTLIKYKDDDEKINKKGRLSFAIDKILKINSFNNNYFANEENDYENDNYNDFNRSFCISNNNKNLLNKSITLNINNNNQKIAEDTLYKIIEKNRYTFDLIIIILCCISCQQNKNINKIDLLLNDSYTNEFISYFKDKFHLDINSIDTEFHILDYIVLKAICLNNINIEINSLDILTFDRLLSVLNNNSNIKSLRLSLFSSDITYCPQSLYKIYSQLTHIKNFSKIKQPFESAVLEYIYPFYIVNLLLLFNIIKNKSTIRKIGINLEIPDIISRNQNYMISILKFILNILLFINDNKCKFQKVTLLSPPTILDGKISNSIDKIFSSINYEKNNMYLNELSLQFQMIHIHNITKLVSSNLVILNIGDLDIVSFEELIKYIISYKFAKKSILNKISISLAKQINAFSPKLKVLFRELFNMKLNNLKSLNLYTNINLKNENDYSYLFKILKNNWISSYNITFSEQSRKITRKWFNRYIDKNSLFDYDTIFFLVPHNLENEFLNEEINAKEIWTSKDDIIYWFLKYLFIHRYFYISKNFNHIKTCIYNILKYLYFQQKVKINHFLENIEDDENKDED